MTSVKEFRVDEPPTAGELGVGWFEFTDAYSVFDWGRMPDAIPRKGASLCTMGAFNFELLEAAGVPTHYRGVATGDRGATAGDETADGEGAADDVGPLADADEPPTEMAIDLTRVPDLPYDSGGYDYDAYHREAGEHYLVPLEIVFRNTVPIGSSLRKRAAPADVDLDYDEWPDEVVELPDPVIEFSTKYEEQDRYLSREDADEIAGLASVDALEELARDVNGVVTDRAERRGFVHEDGKIECLYHDGEVKVADVVGTFDENRFAYDGQEVSKEVVRQYYKREDPGWVEAVGAAKETAAERDVADWRPLVDVEPEPLPEPVVRAVSDLYAAGANAYTDEVRFDAPPIDEAVDSVRDL